MSFPCLLWSSLFFDCLGEVSDKIQIPHSGDGSLWKLTATLQEEKISRQPDMEYLDRSHPMPVYSSLSMLWFISSTFFSFWIYSDLVELLYIRSSWIYFFWSLWFSELMVVWTWLLVGMVTQPYWLTYFPLLYVSEKMLGFTRAVIAVSIKYGKNLKLRIPFYPLPLYITTGQLASLNIIFKIRLYKIIRGKKCIKS